MVKAFLLCGLAGALLVGAVLLLASVVADLDGDEPSLEGQLAREYQAGYEEGRRAVAYAASQAEVDQSAAEAPGRRRREED